MTRHPVEGRGHLQVALETAEFAPVFPCVAPSKRPATPNGFKNATRDRTLIQRWWTRHPDHLVGIPSAGLVVIDLDIPKESSQQPPDLAWQGWRRLAEPHGWSPESAVMVDTPSGGLHIYHRQPPGAEVRNSASKLAPYIDVRADGGYVIAPGSTLPDGRSYELRQPTVSDLPTAPPWLLQACSRPPAPETPHPAPRNDAAGTVYGLRALENELGRLATAAEGTRNDSLVRAAYRVGQLIGGAQLDLHHATSQLLAVALRIGLTETESVATIRSGLTKGTQHPRSPAA